MTIDLTNEIKVLKRKINDIETETVSVYLLNFKDADKVADDALDVLKHTLDATENSLLKEVHTLAYEAAINILTLKGRNIGGGELC